MRKTARRRSFSRRFFDACVSSVSRLVLAAGDVVVRNPVVAGGATAFLVTLGFVASNAIWYQPQAHDNVFFKTRPQQVFRSIDNDQHSAFLQAGADNTITSAEQTSAIKTAPAAADTVRLSADLPDTTVDGGDLPALAANGDKAVAILQYNLKQLGFYDGNVDGLTGPQTRKALEQWQNVQARLAPAALAAGTETTSASAAGTGTRSAAAGGAAAPKPATMTAESNAVTQNAAVIPARRPEQNPPRPIPLVEKTPPPILVKAAPQSAPDLRQGLVHQAALPQPAAKSQSARQPAVSKVSAEELVRIQAGLKAFGNDMVVVDGMPGKSTEDAIREFQKLFRLNVTGQPDPELIGKMREIGLIS